jgi:hypothetical protein
MASPAAGAVLHMHTSADGSTAPAQPQQDDATAAECQRSGASSTSRTSGSTTKSKSITLYAANSIGHHYFGSQQQLEVITEPTKMTGSVSAQPDVDEKPPPRVNVRTKLYTNSVVLAALAGVLGWTYYNVVTNILLQQRWYALIMLAVIPIGITFFAFAVNTAVMGVFSLIFGELCGQVHTAQQSRSSKPATSAFSHATCCAAVTVLLRTNEISSCIQGEQGSNLTSMRHISKLCIGSAVHMCFSSDICMACMCSYNSLALVSPVHCSP